MGFNKGLSANIKLPSGNASDGYSIRDLNNKIENIDEKMVVARVTDIILDINYPDIFKLGGLSAIGKIFFEESTTGGTGIAKPFNPQISAYPLINEHVLIFRLPNKDMGLETTEESHYYINMVSLWNHPHHNAYPDPELNLNIPSSQQKSYEDVQAGSISKVTNETSSLDLNSPNNDFQQTFFERQNIHPLLPFAGDIIYQGRWGNSIRLGSTAKAKQKKPSNPWSDYGKNGNPITLIRNGQPLSSSNAGWEPIVEDINRDQSSVYLTSNQRIPINVASERYFSYTQRFGEVPTIPSQYKKNQVIISSGRLVFNASSDHILLSSQRTISFEAVKGFNFDTPSNFVIDVGTTIKLGSKDAIEPAVKGETLRNDLHNLCYNLKQLVSILKYSQVWPGGTVAADATISTVCTTLEMSLDNLLDDFSKDSNGNSIILSKTVKLV